MVGQTQSQKQICVQLGRGHFLSQQKVAQLLQLPKTLCNGFREYDGSGSQEYPTA